MTQVHERTRTFVVAVVQTVLEVLAEVVLYIFRLSITYCRSTTNHWVLIRFNPEHSFVDTMFHRDDLTFDSLEAILVIPHRWRLSELSKHIELQVDQLLEPTFAAAGIKPCGTSLPALTALILDANSVFKRIRFGVVIGEWTKTSFASSFAKLAISLRSSSLTTFVNPTYDGSMYVLS